MNTRKVRTALLVACVGLPCLLPAVVAEASSPQVRAFPGANGRIALTRFSGAHWRIFSIEANGSGPLRLTGRSMDSYTPSWSANGAKIVFRRRGDGAEGLWIMNADGSRLKKVPRTPWFCGFPAFSPDGKKIAYSSEKDGRIYLINRNGTEKTRLTGPGRNIAPVFSPDGTKIAFFSRRSGDAEIFVMNTDGSDQTPLTKNVLEDTFPDWSPDGTTLAFQRTRASGDAEIYTVPAAGGVGATRLTNHLGNDLQPAWSPGGDRIAFVFADGRSDSEIWIMDADGSNLAAVTSNRLDEYFPDWKPF